jgi:hypothetical protein
MDILHKYDELGKRFPDLAEYSQTMLASVAEYTMNELAEGDTLNLTALYQQITQEFEDNESLCTYMQNAYETSLRNIITNDLNALIDAGLTINLTSNQFEKTFEVIRQSNIFYDLLFCEGLEGMPIAVPHGQYIVSADIMDTFENLIRKSYGEISEDGRRFTKKDENGNWLFEKFAETPAYDILFMELLSDEKKAVEFVKGVLDPELQKEVAAAQAAEANKQLQLVTK